MSSAVEQELRELIQGHGRITFAQFMQTCLYSPKGGFYSSRADRISAHFRTSATSHPAFGALIALQLEQMWHVLGKPTAFHVIEVGSGDGSLARSIVDASQGLDADFGKALSYVAADYEPWWPLAPAKSAGLVGTLETLGRRGIQRVKAEGLRPFRNVTGCILSNELLDNFPVHRFVIQEGRVKEAYVTLQDGGFAEVLDEPSTPRLEERLKSLGLALPEGFRGEVNLGMEDWAGQLAATLERGFALTIDYGEEAGDLYAPPFAEGTMVCFHEHIQSADPYQLLGQQDITTLVDFTSLTRLGERQGLVTLGYSKQHEFLENLGFSLCVDALEQEDLSYAHKILKRMALMSLVDPEEHGNFKVLAQAKGVGPGAELLGFKAQGT